ncbi:MAG: hypothetical protein PGN15_09780 [Aeromicrobium erythreum]
MPFWQLLILALIPSAAAVGAALVGFRDLGLRRRLETSKQFVSLFATAHGRPIEERPHPVGVGEQVATIHLIADFAMKEPVLVNAAVAGLRNLASWDDPATAATPKIDLSGMDVEVPENLLRALESGMAKAISKSNSASGDEIAQAARAALKRLEPRMKAGDRLSAPRSSSPASRNDE